MIRFFFHKLHMLLQSKLCIQSYSQVYWVYFFTQLSASNFKGKFFFGNLRAVAKDCIDSFVDVYCQLPFVTVFFKALQIFIQQMCTSIDLLVSVRYCQVVFKSVLLFGLEFFSQVICVLSLKNVYLQFYGLLQGKSILSSV